MIHNILPIRRNNMTIQTMYAIAMALLSLGAPPKELPPTDMKLTTSTGVTVELCPPASVHMICESIWGSQTKEEYKQDISAVVEGEIIGTSEVKIRFNYNDRTYETYETLYSVFVKENFWNAPENIEIVVAVPESSYADIVDIPNFKIGDEAVFLLRDTAAIENDPMDLKSYAGYYVMSPADIGVVKNDTVTVDSIISASPDEQAYANQSKVILTFDDFRSKAADLLSE